MEYLCAAVHLLAVVALGVGVWWAAGKEGGYKMYSEFLGGWLEEDQRDCPKIGGPK